MDIRVETEGDRAEVEALHLAAFGEDVLPVLVRGLRAGDGFVPGWSLVAFEAGEVVGHTMVTYVPLEALDGATRRVPCLSPLGVRPDAQGRGVGRALVDAVCAAVEADGEPFVVLEGNPAMYSRFGFAAAQERGLRRPSERIPPAAFQVRTMAGDRPDDPALRGRVLYPDVFWDNDCVGRPLDRPAFLDALERACRVIEDRCRTAGGPDATALAKRVPACPGWTVADVVAHLGFIHRFVAAWVTAGRRPRPVSVPAVAADDPALLAWFGEGWRALQDLLDERGFETPTATWSPWDATAGFWFRRMAHEAVVHAVDVVEALPHKASRRWWVDDALALDGIDEVVRLWLGTRLGEHAGGEGQVVRLETAGAVALVPRANASGDPFERLWTVGLHGGITETHDVPTAPDAVVGGMPVELYRWLWGRPAGVNQTGDPAAVAALRSALTRALQ